MKNFIFPNLACRKHSVDLWKQRNLKKVSEYTEIVSHCMMTCVQIYFFPKSIAALSVDSVVGRLISCLLSPGFEKAYWLSIYVMHNRRAVRDTLCNLTMRFWASNFTSGSQTRCRHSFCLNLVNDKVRRNSSTLEVIKTIKHFHQFQSRAFGKLLEPIPKALRKFTWFALKKDITAVRQNFRATKYRFMKRILHHAFNRFFHTKTHNL